MGPLSDDGSEMTSRRSSDALSEADADALLSGRATTGHDELREIIGLMRTASAVPAPPPTAALAAVLKDGFGPLPVESTPSASRWRRWNVRITAATTAAMLVTLGAATANALPAPIQTAVADVVGAVTPLELPRSSADAGAGSDGRGGPSDEPPAVPFEQPNRNAETAADETSGEPADSTPVMPQTAPPRPKPPAVVTPPRQPEATATATDEPDVDEPDADVRESDVADADDPEQPESSGGADAQESDEADTDEPEQPESGEVDQGDADDRELFNPVEPALEGDGPEQDEPDEEA